MRRMSNARCAGVDRRSNVSSWSLKAARPRYCSMSRADVVAVALGATGKPGNGPVASCTTRTHRCRCRRRLLRRSRVTWSPRGGVRAAPGHWAPAASRKVRVRVADEFGAAVEVPTLGFLMAGRTNAEWTDGADSDVGAAAGPIRRASLLRGSELVGDPYPYFDWLRAQCRCPPNATTG